MDFHAAAIAGFAVSTKFLLIFVNLGGQWHGNYVNCKQLKAILMYDKAIKEEFWCQTNDHRQIANHDIWNFLEV